MYMYVLVCTNGYLGVRNWVSHLLAICQKLCHADDGEFVDEK